MSDLFEKVYNPDVLTCLANLSNDEVFTPPEVANQMLDMLPQELFENPSTTFLDPACKSGIFLREIAKRLLKARIPEYEELSRELSEKKRNKVPLDAADEFFEQQLQEAVDHIFHKQLFGIAITELTSLMSRRSVYCSKYPNSEFSITQFETAEGNIRFRRVEHSWDKNGKCIFCGASKEQYERGEELETHAYEWIHVRKPEEIFKMKFDVIISNPPYQLNDGGNGASAKPIYHLFVEQAKKLRPRFLTMITPSRWFNGGKGLDQFRESMLNDAHITHLVDYQNAKDCFPGISIGGGVSYFLWERDRQADCSVTNIVNGQANTQVRSLNQYPVFVRYNEALNIIKKVKSKGENSLVEFISARNPYGLSTNMRGKVQPGHGDLTLYSSNGISYINAAEIMQGRDTIYKFKVLLSRVTSEHAGEPDKDGKYKVIANIRLLKPNEICTDSYVIACPSDNETIVKNFYNYLRTKFVRFLILQALSSINLSRERYEFVPAQDFSKIWTDEELYAKYGLTDEEIDFIESMIKPMDIESGDSNDR